MRDFYDLDWSGMNWAPASYDHGIAFYRGVIVVWDEDHDERALSLIDVLLAQYTEQPLAVYETQGDCGVLWLDRVPECLDTGFDIQGDHWNACHKAIRVIEDHRRGPGLRGTGR